MVQELETIVKDAMEWEDKKAGKRQELSNSESEETAKHALDGLPNGDRQKLFENVAGMKAQIIGIIDSVIEGLPKTVEPEDDVLVDDVLVNLISNKERSKDQQENDEKKPGESKTATTKNLDSNNQDVQTSACSHISKACRPIE
jgi:hypothetical protein